MNQALSQRHQNLLEEGIDMATGEDIPQAVPIIEFGPPKQAQFFDALRKARFSGQLSLESTLGQKWVFYLYLGRILYSTGGVHSVRRWKRHLAAYCPEIGVSEIREVTDALNSASEPLKTCWEYEMLCTWIEQQKITRDQALQIIWSIVSEVLFDITQANEVTFSFALNNVLDTSLILLDAERLFPEIQKKWQSWQQARIADRSPNQAPVIYQPEQLRQKVSTASYQTLVSLLNGKRTLRDLAILTKRDVEELTRSLLPYLQAGFVKLIDIPDSSAPVINLPVPTVPVHPASSPIKLGSEGPLVACIDDSPAVCRTMETILTTSGYRFVSIQDSLRAIPALLSCKPDLIFLDLVMPNTNGYEICSQLRKISFFRNTPIVILTGNDGLVDRVRAKVVGASDFLSKPVEAQTVISVAYKHLKHLHNGNSLVVG